METIYAYLAGIIDGEGCISIRKCKQGKYIYFKPMIEVSMTHRPTIEFVAKTFGNSVWYEVRAIYRHKKIYKWRATGTNVIPILKNIFSLFAFSDTDTTLSVYNTCKIGINSFHNYNVSY